MTGSSSNKYFNFCPNSDIYSLGKQRNENTDKTLSEQKHFSSACDFSHEKGLDKLDVARSQNLSRILIAHLNINSLNKFEILKETITNKIDIPLISETKLFLKRRLLWFGPNSLISIEKKIHLSMN